jgi:hypothetical protein
VSRMKVVLVAVVALAIVVTGCSKSSETTTSAGASSSNDVVFGQGELPDTMPAGFPLPQGSSIGSTMVVPKTGFTEVVVRVGAEQGVTAEYFNEALSQAGFTVDQSAADGEHWLIEFSDDSAKGTIDISTAVQGVAQAVVRYNVP